MQASSVPPTSTRCTQKTLQLRWNTTTLGLMRGSLYCGRSLRDRLLGILVLVPKLPCFPVRLDERGHLYGQQRAGQPRRTHSTVGPTLRVTVLPFSPVRRRFSPYTGLQCAFFAHDCWTSGIRVRMNDCNNLNTGSY